MVNRDTACDEIAVMVSAAQFAETPPALLDESLEFSRAKYSRAMFRRFLSLFVEGLVSTVSDYTDREITGRTSKRQHKTPRQRVENKMLELMLAVEEGEPQRKVATYRKGRSSTRKSDAGAGGRVALGLSLTGPTGNAEVQLGKGVQRGEEESVASQESGLMAVNLSRIRSLLARILEMAKIRTMYLLIDEWMQLDKTLNLGIQPYFAELLKHVFFNHKCMAVKIASVWHSTNLYDRLDMDKSKGIELGQDIEIGADLDTAFMEAGEVVGFFKTMLFRRLCYQVPELADLERGGEIDDVFVEELFDNERNFESLIAASHGMPRDFWRLFDRCARRIKCDFAHHCITRQLVEKISQMHYLQDKRKRLEKSSPAQVLWQRINELMARTGGRAFLVASAEAKASRPLRKLVDEELVHPVPSAMTPRAIRDQFKMFGIDYGNYLDWRRSQPGAGRGTLDAGILPTLPPDAQSEDFLIEIGDIATSLVTCPYCHKSFGADSPVYLKLGGCPACGEHLDSRSHD